MVRSLEGLSERRVRALARRFVTREVKPHVYEPMKQLVAELKRTGFEPWIVSAGAPYWVGREVARLVGIPVNNVVAPRAEVKGGKLTGKLRLPDPIGEGKVKRAKREIRQRLAGAAGDSGGDIPLLDAAELGIAINPNAALAAHAARKGYAVEHIAPSAIQRPSLLRAPRHAW